MNPRAVADGRASSLGPAGERELPFCSTKLVKWFAVYLRRYFARHFTAVRLAKSGHPPAASTWPIVVYSNHASWWDPILFMLVADTCFPGRPGYGPMDAEALRKYRIFRRMGVFGVEADSRRGAIRFMRCSRAALERPQSILWVTAEGHFSDPRTRPVRIASGLAHLARAVDRATMVPLAIEYPFWNERHPEVLLRFGDAIGIETGPARGAGEWRSLLEERLRETMDELAADARARDPRRFDTLLRGRTGIGGVYDLGRRLRATLRGERFRGSHGNDEP